LDSTTDFKLDLNEYYPETYTFNNEDWIEENEKKISKIS